MRNFIIPLIRNNTSLIVIVSCISLIFLFKKNKKLFFIGLFWILPAAIANQWWDSLLNGRHALIASFGLAFLTAYLIRRRLIFIVLVIIYLAFISVPILNLLKKPIPYLQEADAVKLLPKDSFLIESHFARSQIQEIKSLKLLLFCICFPVISQYNM